VKGRDQEVACITFVWIWTASFRLAGSGVETGPATGRMASLYGVALFGSSGSGYACIARVFFGG
jgi:hypothetical protein